MSNDPRARAFEALAQLLVSEDSLGSALDSVLRTVADAVPAAAHAGLTTRGAHGRAATPIYTDPDVPDMDQAQYDSDRGPCMDAWRLAETIRIDDLATATAVYPEFVAAASRHGVRSTLSVPLLVAGESIGALNLYSLIVDGFSTDDERLVRDLTPATAAFISNAQAYWQAYEVTEQLNEALTSRSGIDHAIGVLMAGDRSLEPADAFDVLRRASQRENVKLREIARRVVERRVPPEVLDKETQP